MPKRWVVGGIWAVVMSAGLLALARNGSAEQPATQGKNLISDVIISGNRRMSIEQIQSHLRTRPGKRYNSGVVDDDVCELYKTGQFSSITAWLQPDGTDHVKVNFCVREMPNMVQKVTFLGARHIKPEDLQNITGVRPGAPLNPNLNRQGCQKILEKYAEQGRSFADCQLIKGGDLADTEVVYQITEGPKVKVRDIKFIGDFHFVSSARLLTQTTSSRRWYHRIGDIYNKRMAEADVEWLYYYFRGFGFLDVRISLESQRSAEGGEVTLIFHIDEGTRYRVQEEPDVHSRQEIPREQLLALSSFKPGDYLDEETMKHDIKAITDYMGRRGRAVHIDAIPFWVPDVPGVCNLRYEVIERPPARVSQVFIIGNERTCDNAILRQAPLFPSGILTFPETQK
jgi:outer membrane protein insertion porin family